jgi:hypothetical protein
MAVSSFIQDTTACAGDFLHTARRSFVKARTTQVMQIRVGRLAEFGFVVPQGIRCA